MTLSEGVRGKPLIALVVVLVSWIGLRAMMWEVSALAPIDLRGRHQIERPTFGTAPAAADTAAPSLSSLPVPARELLVRQAHRLPDRFFPQPRRGRKHGLTPVPYLVSLASVERTGESIASPPTVAWRKADEASRWTADAWLLLRDGGGTLAAGASPATYGASQAGAVLRYRLAVGSRHRSAAYLRATAALGGSGEQEAALGISARPLPDLPLVAGVELRAHAVSGRVRARPAAMVVTELPPLDLPAAVRAEIYAQAGYVGGRFATPFADAQVRIERAAASIGSGEVRIGAGAWGGAQKGAARIDVGPAATAAVGLGKNALARLAVDWRFRVGGNAAPSSGPALTLSAGF